MLYKSIFLGKTGGITPLARLLLWQAYRGFGYIVNSENEKNIRIASTVYGYPEVRVWTSVYTYIGFPIAP